MPDRPALIESRAYAVRDVPWLRPFDWLRRGWDDLLRAPLPALVHGLALAAVGALLLAIGRDRFWFLAGAFTGFLLVAPILATGLYAISRALEHGEPATMRTAMAAWRPERRLVTFGLLLALAGTGWVLTSASLIHGFAGSAIQTPSQFLHRVVLDDRSMLFEAWLGLGALLAAPVFASSVVAIPLMMDRPISVLAAVLTSWRVVMQHPGALALWAALVMLLTTLGMAMALVGLVVVLPWLAHASWHAYRDLVRPVRTD